MKYKFEDLKCKKTTTLSLRIDSELYDNLKNESDRIAISINSLVTGIIEKHLSWYRFTKELGFAAISKKTTRQLFEQISDEKLKEIAQKSGFSVMNELLLLMYEKIEFKTIVDFIKIQASFQGMVNHRITDNGEHILTIHHGISQKFSCFLEEIFKTITNEHDIIFTMLNSQQEILSFSLQEI